MRTSTITDFVDQYLDETQTILSRLDRETVRSCARGLAQIRDAGGRLFILGVGGSAGHASHAVNDFRKICNFEAYAPTDNVSELTARVNDEGWETVFVEWLKGSRLDHSDALLVFSVGGGNKEENVSAGLIRAIDHAHDKKAKVFGIVGSEDGYTATEADACIVVPALYPTRRTPHSEGLTAVLWHLLVSHPDLAQVQTKWESLAK